MFRKQAVTKYGKSGKTKHKTRTTTTLTITALLVPRGSRTKNSVPTISLDTLRRKGDPCKSDQGALLSAVGGCHSFLSFQPELAKSSVIGRAAIARGANACEILTDGPQQPPAPAPWEDMRNLQRIGGHPNWKSARNTHFNVRFRTT